jgi:GDP-L-fucose synthase
MQQDSKIYIPGTSGMLGLSLLNTLIKSGYKNIITSNSSNLNLTNQNDVNNFFTKNKPEYVFLAAAKVGGIGSNISECGDFIYQNLMIQSNVIHACLINGVKKLIFISSGCVYPKLAKNPINEEQLLTGPLEPSNEHYAIAKIAGLKMCEAYNKQFNFQYSVVVPCNIYGINDNFNDKTSHVMAALIKKFYLYSINKIDKIDIWGSGNQRREFIFADDVSNFCKILAESNNFCGVFNCGYGNDISIKELCSIIQNIINPNRKLNIVFDASKPEGHYQKLFDISKTTRLTGWKPSTSLSDGILQVYNWIISNQGSIRGW